MDPERPDDVDAVVEREVAGDDVLRELVGRNGCEADRREAEPLHRAGAQRALSHRDGSERVRRRSNSHIDFTPQGLAHVRLSLLPRSTEDADARRRSMRAGPTPLSSMILSRAPCPETMVTALRGKASVSAMSRTTASLARPCSGRAVTRTFHASPWRPMISARPLPGLTRSRRRVVAAVMPRIVGD